MLGFEDPDYLHLSVDKTKKDYHIIRDLVNSPEEHHGKIVFIKEVVDPIVPFVKAKRFYFNDHGEWYTFEDENLVR